MMDAVIGIGSLVLAVLLGLWLAYQNHKELERTREERVAARRAYKKIKNEKMRIFYGLKNFKEEKKND